MQSNTRLGIWLMIATTFVFSMQDGISRYLASHYNVFMVVMIRYWFFAAFVMVLARRSKGSIRAAARPRNLSCKSSAACFWPPRSASWSWPS